MVQRMTLEKEKKWLTTPYLWEVEKDGTLIIIDNKRKRG
jgi:hypothetical protein